MDFGTLLHVAKRNNEELSKNAGKYYSTKFSAPKKETKEKKLSDNIKKFLAKKEREEREKAKIEKQKRDELLAMRDEKAKNKIKKMLKVIKSANKSVLDDAVDKDDTAVTIQGPDQPDEDDYGYVSQESSAFYQKYMDRVKTLPEENKFAPSRPAHLTDLAGTKDRVKAAILREQEEANLGKRSKSSLPTPSSSSSTKTYESSSKTTESHNSISTSSHRRRELYDAQLEREMEEQKKREEAQKRAKARPPPPPPMDFQQLLKLAEKKQYEPVEIVVEEKKEPERLLTKKEKRELEEQERRKKEELERRKKEKLKGGSSSSAAAPINKMQPNGRIPKLNGASSAPSSISEKSPKPLSKPAQSTLKPVSDDKFKKPAAPISSSKVDNTKLRPEAKGSSSGLKPKAAVQSSSSTARSNDSSKPLSSKPSSKPPMKTSSALPSSSSQQNKTEPKRPYNGPTREFPPKDPSTAKKSQLQNGRSSDTKPNGASREMQRTREFPPPDVRRRPEPPRKQQAIKRRIYDDYDDEDEYDSELDDFIDDGPEEGENYSSYIKEIFGYDRSRYRDTEEEDVDKMESSFAQQMREEYVSKKIGLLEDLEDMRKEEEEKKRKALMKKRKLK